MDGTAVDHASAARKLLGRYARFSEEGRWRRLLMEGVAPFPAPFVGRQMVFRLMAAVELEDTQEIERIVALARELDLSPADRIRLAQRLIVAERLEAAWEILSRAETANHKSRIGKMARGIASAARDPVVANRANSLADELVPDQTSDLRPVFVHRLDASDTPVLTPAGQVRVVYDDTSLQGRAKVFGDLLVGWDTLLSSPSPPMIAEYHDVWLDREGAITQPSGDVLPWETVQPGTVISLLASTHGFFHWFCETIQVLALRWNGDWDPTYSLAIGRDPPAFCLEFLDLMGFARDRILRVEAPIRCERLLVGPHAIKSFQFWKTFEPLYGALLKKARAPSTAFSRIYISRRDTARRVLKNEAEVERLMEGMGVQPVLLSKHTVAEQIGIIASANVIVAPHGAGLAHLVYARPGMRILELMPARQGWEFIRYNFARLSRMRGHLHTLWLEPSSPVNHAWNVNVAALQRFMLEDTDFAQR